MFCSAQLGNNWCFADSGFVNFGGGIATSNSYSNLYQSPSSSISDDNGNLLFYSNGANVWNKQHLLMQNGVGLGYYPTTNSYGPANAIILPFPNNDSLYYLFYTNSIASWSQLRLFYSVININKQNGFGEVVQKDILISNENLTYFTIVQSNNTSFWLVSKHVNQPKFYAFKILDTGVSTQPEISDFTNNNPLLSDFNGYNGDFYIKASPNGSKIVGLTFSVFGVHKPYVYDFNKQTGILSNAHQLATPNVQGGSRISGISFSPNSKRLYIIRNQLNTNLIAQYNLNNLSIASPFMLNDTCLVIQQSVTSATNNFYDLQIAPDNKIYISRERANYLSCITNPNDTGNQCIFIDKSVILQKGTCFTDLPFFYNTIYAPVLKIQALRQGCNDIAFSFTGPFSGTTYKQWNFGDGSFSNDSAIVHQYNATNLPDSILVTLAVVNVGNTDTLIKRKWIPLYKKPIASIGNISYNGCTNASIHFNATATPQDTASIVQTNWHLGNGYTIVNTNSFIYNYIDTGNYLVKYWAINSRGCSDTAYKNMVIDKKTKAGFGLSNPICSNNNFTITGQISSYNTNITSIKYNFFNGDSVIKIDNTPFNKQQQDTGSFALLQTIKSSAGCVDSFSANYRVLPVPIINAGGNKILFSGSSILLNAYANNVLPNIAYTWQPAIELSNAAILQPICAATSTRVYKLTATSTDGCVASDSLEVKVFAKIIIPNAFSPNGDGVNDQWDLNFASAYPTIKVSIYSRNGTRVYYNTGVYTPWKGTNLQNNKALHSGTYYYIIDLGNGENPFSGAVTLLR